jgi:predicted nucleic acid-binding protein
MNGIDRYMLDTNIFNAVLDQKLSPRFPGHVLVTGVQLGEINATRTPERKAALLSTFEEVNPTSLKASSFAFDIEGAGFDQAYWNDGTERFERMLERLRQLDKKQNKRDDLRNQTCDILIAETALKNEAVLVSDDSNLRQVIAEFGGRAITLAEAYALVNEPH